MADEVRRRFVAVRNGERLVTDDVERALRWFVDERLDVWIEDEARLAGSLETASFRFRLQE